MSETRIYKPGSEHLNDLLRQATSPEGATLLIPDLQRPFRWSPDQVTRLLDSLLRGWPFGTLLLWALDDKKIADIPFRTFWKLVDRISPEAGSKAGTMDPPVRRGYRMVLDGQQRIQSLVVALSGEAGFKLEDREWWASIDPERAKGKAGKHWSRGVLCLDLDEYARQRADGNVRVQHVDYMRALQWVVCAAQDGRSSDKKPVNYELPIDALADHPGRFIRLSRLWDLAQVGTPSFKWLTDRIRNDLLPEHGVDEARANELLNPLLDLVQALGQVKQTEVGFLELQPMEREGFDAEQYDDAIVSIFTRLNTGGRALSEEEITFAWIKKFWVPETPESKEATPAFEQLHTALKAKGISLGMDKLVQAVSVIWAVLEREGRLLRPVDLVKGDKLKPLAPGVSKRWARLSNNLIETAAILEELGLEHGSHYESINAFITLACWRFLGEEWTAGGKRKIVAHNVMERLDALIRQHALRFLVLTSWAGRWSGSSGSWLEKYAGSLAEDHAAAGKCDAADEVLRRLESRLTQWIAEVIPKAVDHVQALEAGRREDVRWYFVPLWVWHRLDVDRQAASEGINLPKLRKRPSTEVDHIVSFENWQTRIAKGEGTEDWENDVNQLGNCFLLQKNFNVTKLNKPLAELLAKIDKLAPEEERRAWTALMDIPGGMVDPAQTTLGELRVLIGARTARIKKDLESFVRDEKRLADTNPAIDVSGAWRTAHVFQEVPIDGPMQLQQEGDRVTGTYGELGSITGELEGHRLRGKWKERAEYGWFEWTFDAGGSSFAGTWGAKKSSHDGGAWTGSRNALQGASPGGTGEVDQ